MSRALPTVAMLAFWNNPKRFCAPETPPLFAIVHLAGSNQPCGYVQGWSVHAAAAERQAAIVEGNQLLPL